MFKKLTFVSVLLFSSVIFAAEPPPTPNPIPSPSVDPTIVIIDGKLVKATDVLAPVIKITGAESPIDLGDLVFLECKIDNSLPQFIKNSAYKWTIEGKNARGTSTNQVFFGAGIKNTTIKAHVDVALTYQVDAELVIKTVSGDVDVKIGDDTPNPPIPPDPPKPPTPDLTGTPKEIFDMVQSTFGKNLSTDDTKKAATVIANDFDTAVANIQSGKYPSFAAFSDDLKTMNQSGVKLLGLDIGKFDTFRSSLNTFLYNYYEKNGVPNKDTGMALNGNSTLVGLTDWVPILTDISTGLKAASK